MHLKEGAVLVTLIQQDPHHHYHVPLTHTSDLSSFAHCFHFSFSLMDTWTNAGPKTYLYSAHMIHLKCRKTTTPSNVRLERVRVHFGYVCWHWIVFICVSAVYPSWRDSFFMSPACLIMKTSTGILSCIQSKLYIESPSLAKVNAKSNMYLKSSIRN